MALVDDLYHEATRLAGFVAAWKSGVEWAVGLHDMIGRHPLSGSPPGLGRRTNSNLQSMTGFSRATLQRTKTAYF